MEKTKATEVESKEIVPEDNQSTGTPLELLSLAISKDIEVDKLEKLLELQERWELKESRKLFFDALSKFQAEVPEIEKSKSVGYDSRKGGSVNYKYAPLSKIDEAIKEPLAKYGLSKSFEIKEENNRIYVTCNISHTSGFTKSTTMSAIADVTGNKNSIQASGSTLTYLQRYTLIGALGLTTADEDNDGIDAPAQDRKPYQKTAPQPPQKVNVEVVDTKKPIVPNSPISKTSGKKFELPELFQKFKKGAKIRIGRNTYEVLRGFGKKNADREYFGLKEMVSGNVLWHKSDDKTVERLIEEFNSSPEVDPNDPIFTNI